MAAVDDIMKPGSGGYRFRTCIWHLAFMLLAGCAAIEPLPDLMGKVCQEMHRPPLPIPTVMFIDGNSLQIPGSSETIRGFYVPSQEVVCINEDNWDRNVVIHELAHHAGAGEAEATMIERRLSRFFK